MSNHCLIWAVDQNKWWGEPGMGYQSHVNDAFRYPRDAAYDICRRNNSVKGRIISLPVELSFIMMSSINHTVERTATPPPPPVDPLITALKGAA